MTRTQALRALLTRPPAERSDDPERCDLCGVVIHREHRHLLDLTARQLRCACRACAVLFDRDGAGGHRLVPDRRRYLTGFALGDELWASLNIPVRMAFSYVDSSAGRRLFYPSPLGVVESGLDPATCAHLETANPVLREMAPDVEALLVNRTGDARDHWLVPIDDCYALVGLIRTRWKGLAGGPDVWTGIATFFAELRGKAKDHDKGGRL
jgi:hypothetical protein